MTWRNLFREAAARAQGRGFLPESAWWPVELNTGNAVRVPLGHPETSPHLFVPSIVPRLMTLIWLVCRRPDGPPRIGPLRRLRASDRD